MHVCIVWMLMCVCMYCMCECECECIVCLMCVYGCPHIDVIMCVCIHVFIRYVAVCAHLWVCLGALIIGVVLPWKIPADESRIRWVPVELKEGSPAEAELRESDEDKALSSQDEKATWGALVIGTVFWVSQGWAAPGHWTSWRLSSSLEQQC